MVFISGFAASLLGYGGYAPILVALGLHPIVANATGMYILLINSLINVIFFVGMGDFELDYEFSTGFVVGIGTILGMYLQEKLLVKIPRTSIILFLMCAILVLSAIIVGL